VIVSFFLFFVLVGLMLGKFWDRLFFGHSIERYSARVQNSAAGVAPSGVRRV